jgi:hypothetical protein
VNLLEPSGPVQACTWIALFYILLIEKRREFNLETNLLIIYYEKAFDNIKRQILFNILKSKHIPDTLLRGIVDDYAQNEGKILQLSKLVKIYKGV